MSHPVAYPYWSSFRAVALVLVLMTGIIRTPSGAATVELVSRATPLPDSIGTSRIPSLSADGRYVAFLSDAPNLVPGQVDDDYFHDVFLHDRITGTTTLVSHAAGSPNRPARSVGTYYSLDIQISPDGRYVAFASLGNNLVPGVIDTNERTDVFLYDRVTETMTLVSHAAGLPNVASNGLSYGVQLSADGNYLIFNSRAKDLVANQSEPGTDFIDDVFLWERVSNTVTLISRKSGTTATVAAGISNAVGISADGDFILFTSTAADLLSNVSDTNGKPDIFIYQRSSRQTTLVSRASGEPGTAVGAAGVPILGNDVVLPVLSTDGRYVAFASRANNLAPGQVDDGSSLDAFLFDRVSGEMRLASRTNASPQTAGGGVADPYNGLAMSADGRYVAFASRAANLVPGQVDTNQQDDVFVYDRVTGTMALASHTRDSLTTATTDPSRSGWPSFSADGRFLAFASNAVDLISNQTDHSDTFDIFLYDQNTKGTALVSHPRSSSTTTANDNSLSPVISANGAVIAFTSAATDLGEGQFDPNRFRDLFLYHRASGEITSPSRRDPGLPAVTPHGPSTLENLSADGRYVVFLSRATGLVPGQIDEPNGFDDFGHETGTWDVFLRDQVTGKTVLLSRSSASKVTAVGGTTPALSADGRFAAFTSYERPNGTGNNYPLYLYEQTTDTLTLVNHSPGSQEPEGFPGYPVLSADGRYIAYACHGCGLVPGHPATSPANGSFNEVFLYDRVTGLNSLVSHVAGSPTARGDSSAEFPRISADGRFVLFMSWSTNLVPGQVDTHDSADLFVFDRATGEIALITHTAASVVTTTGNPPTAVGMSADGRFITFVSRATDLVPGQLDTNGENDLFLHDRVTSTTVLVSHSASSPVTAANHRSPDLFGLAFTISLSTDGRFLVYASLATNLVTGVDDSNGDPDLFLYDRLSGKNTLVSRAGGAPGRTANGGAIEPRISADGSRIAFLSESSDLIPGQTSSANSTNLFVRDRIADTAVLVGRIHKSEPFDRGTISFAPILSADGRRAAFTSDATFVQGDFNGDWDVYLWNDTAGPIPLTPCKLLDTRRRADHPALTSNVQRTVTVRGACGVPATAKQVMVKVTVFNPSGKGNLRFYPGAVTGTPSGILRFERGATRTEGFTLPLSANGTLTILPFVAGKGTVHVAVEVTAYEN